MTVTTTISCLAYSPNPTMIYMPPILERCKYLLHVARVVLQRYTPNPAARYIIYGTKSQLQFQHICCIIDVGGNNRCNGVHDFRSIRSICNGKCQNDLSSNPTMQFLLEIFCTMRICCNNA